MKFKAIFVTLGAILFLSVFGACSSDKDDISMVALKGVNNVESTGVMVGATETQASFSVYSSVKPNVTISDTWLTAETSEPSKLNSICQIKLSIQPNTLQMDRQATLTISAAGASISVKVTQAAAEAATEPEPEPAPSDEVQPLLGLKAMDIAKDMFAGWNIGNTLEAIGGETAWGNPKVNESYVAGIKAAGFNAVRIPCSWNQYIVSGSDNQIDPSWLDRVNEVVNMVTSQGMYAILNIHWDGGWLENNIGTSTKPELVEKQRALWTQIANRLAHYNEMLLFAGLNEPNADNAAAANALLEYEQVFVDAVRATGGNNATRTLIFQGPNTDINTTFDNYNQNPTDPAGEGYMMAEIHYYDPYQYTIMEKDESWGKVAWFWGADYHMKGSDRNSTWGEEDWMRGQFDKMKTKFVDNNIPVIVGEYGAYPEEHYSSLQSDSDKDLIKESRAYFYTCVQKYAKERGLIPFVWDTGEIINRNNGEVKKQYMIDAIMEGANSASYPY